MMSGSTMVAGIMLLAAQGAVHAPVDNTTVIEKDQSRIETQTFPEVAPVPRVKPERLVHLDSLTGHEVATTSHIPEQVAGMPLLPQPGIGPTKLEVAVSE